MPNSRLTLRNKLFIDEYLKTKNGSEAVRRVYPNIKRPSSYAALLLRKSTIQEAVSERLKALELSNEDIIRELATIAKTGKIEANRIRCYELLAKIKGLLKDMANTQVVTIAQKLEQELNAPSPVDVTLCATQGNIQ